MKRTWHISHIPTQRKSGPDVAAVQVRKKTTKWDAHGPLDGECQPQARHQHYNNQKARPNTGRTAPLVRVGNNKEDFPVGPTGFGGSRKFGDVMARRACSEWYLKGRFDEIKQRGHSRKNEGGQRLVGPHGHLRKAWL
jgi:hypothetical protein